MTTTNAGATPSDTAVAPTPNASEAPFIIWTFRRTGGTSLRSIFFWLSPFEAWQDEGFNRDRELGAITREFEASQDLAALEASVGDVVARRKNLKHCIEVVPYQVTSSLLRQSVAAGYRHLVLLRLDEVERQLSLALARVTNAWGPSEAAAIYDEIRAGTRKLEPLNIVQIRRELDRDAAALGRLMRLMLQHRANYALTFFEDLYRGEFADRVAEVRRVATLLGLSRAANEADAAFRTALMQRSQGTRDIFGFVPNLDEAKAAIAELTR
ncbi:hypothetical protein Rmf_19290 [Roseomonas fluvialis]|uniref:Sulphotransferase Stf0 domain-containing protein n=2 Tax=Roseomonas fluvialis TaxID=1750527 RepID=A0ABM7Y2H8_9PROT|nr:hypothetical protein Rmf_19290 [Roseomonas fluvialis]